MKRAALSAALLFVATPLAAKDPLFGWPVDCALGTSCYIQQYVDHDTSKGARDFTCGPLSYDTHKGTDIALPSHAARKAGVNVRAAAPGVVRGLRDSMPDVGLSKGNPDAYKGRECGNGVVLDHGGDWQTQYCHLRQGSIAVQKGDRVAMGKVLGQIGFSGKTTFPHLHFSVRKGRQVVDPFDPDGKITCGTQSNKTLWLNAPDYAAGGLISAGINAAPPDFNAIRSGEAANTELAPDAPALILWAFGFGLRAGDELHMVLNGPQGEVARRVAKLERTQAQMFRSVGKRLRGAQWPTGTYVGEMRLMRNGKELSRMRAEMQIK